MAVKRECLFLMLVLCVLPGLMAFAKPVFLDGTTPVFEQNQIVFATVVATDAPYSADPTGQADSTEAINRAMQRVRQLGGGTCFIPAGLYRCSGSLLVPGTVTLQGEWHRPQPGEPLRGTVLMAYAGRGNPDGEAFIRVGEPKQGHAKDLAVWYPEQMSGNIQPYPFTIEGNVSHIRRITLVNSYQGIRMRDNSGSIVSDICGTVLKTGIWTQNSVEFGRVYNGRFSPDYWASLKLPGGSTAVDERAVENYMRDHLIALHIGKSDGVCHYCIQASPALAAADVSMTEDEERRMLIGREKYGLGGTLWGVPGIRRRTGWDPWYFGTHYSDLDRIPSLPPAEPVSTVQRHPARMTPDSIAVVTDAAFGAKGDGQADDTAAIQKALDAAGAAGGGTVFLPHGTFRVTAPLNVPAGVELRGVLATGQIRPWFEPCLIRVDGRPDPSVDVSMAPAAISLQAGAGARGFTLGYAVNRWEPDGQGGLNMTPMPYTFRSLGSDTYIQDVTLPNTWQAVDFASARCDNFQVSDLWATVLCQGIRVGGGTDGGIMRNITMDFGPWQSWKSVPKEGKSGGVHGLYNEWIHNHADLFVFEDCSNLDLFSLAGFYPRRHLIFRAGKSGKGPEHLRFRVSMFDVARDESIRVDAGKDITLCGPFVTGGDSGLCNWLEFDPKFDGTFSVYAPFVQSIFFNRPFGDRPAGFALAWEHSLTTGRPATADTAPEADHPAAAAVDGDPFTWWQSAPKPGSLLTVDLGRFEPLDYWRVISNGLVGHPYKNTMGATLLVSEDGKTFTPVDSFGNNPAPIVSRPLPDGCKARYVRLRVDQGTSPLEYGRARIQQFDVFGFDVPERKE
jgi:hypothetical protein